jgi:hypothetical protein
MSCARASQILSSCERIATSEMTHRPQPAPVLLEVRGGGAGARRAGGTGSQLSMNNNLKCLVRAKQ